MSGGFGEQAEVYDARQFKNLPLCTPDTQHAMHRSGQHKNISVKASARSAGCNYIFHKNEPTRMASQAAERKWTQAEHAKFVEALERFKDAPAGPAHRASHGPRSSVAALTWAQLHPS